jgi:DNA-binding CsgD family transcriptional regulator
MPGRPDIVSIIEAAYVFEGSAREWAARVLAAADRSLGAAPGGFTCEYRINRDRTLTFDRESAAVVRQPPEAIAAIFDGLTQAPPESLSLRLPDDSTAARCMLTSEVDPEFNLSYRRRLNRHGLNDGLNVFCLDLDRTGILLSLGIPDRRMVTAAIRRDLRRVATHMLAALRLRKRLRPDDRGARQHPPAVPLDAVAAVLSPKGVLLHADGEASLADARRALQTAVVNVERARTALRRHTSEALDLWKGLVSARWTLVDQIDAEGTRYIVARENPPITEGLSTLTPTERSVVAYAARGYSTKEISYTLGVSDTTVRVLIMRAVRRIGVRGRDELLALAKPDAADVDKRAPG